MSHHSFATLPFVLSISDKKWEVDQENSKVLIANDVEQEGEEGERKSKL